MSAATIHNYGTDDGWHGKIEEGGEFPPEKDRYHLYIEGGGWRFPASNDEYPGATTDSLFGSGFLSEVYFRDDKEYKGKYSKDGFENTNQARNTIHYNPTSTDISIYQESAEMLRWLPDAFNSLLDDDIQKVDLYPPPLRQKIDEITPWLQSHINSGVYKAGFARTQESYEAGVVPLFTALNKIEKLIAENGGPYVLGKHLTELDLRLYATIIRFDTVYVQHFKTNLGTGDDGFQAY
ncbi:hypothetical protein GRF29_28g520339 [Pseudopithomyces chartarum]|uniref:GST C-terminal domain-containing protein n=1 Tax=Pseudopithomyces chartarum TaxID=1892770 RepID=A0AAN6RHN4_9PLEO|nr:hypothetical protein GRF29_28g520339 [Pseudopithomyces chartarum]